MMDWRNRIIEFKRMKVNEITGHERNPKRHPKHQADAMRGMLDEVGMVDTLKAYYGEDGKLRLFDGHLRQSLDPDQEWPVIITDLTEDEARLMLVAFDPLAALAERDADLLAGLLHDVNVGDAALQQMLTDMAEDAGIVPPDNPYEHWQGMPEFEQEDAFGAVHTLKVHFASQGDIDAFSKLINQSVSDKTKYIWYPKQEKENLKSFRVADES